MYLVTNNRVIITSDIHGNLPLFKKLINKVKLTNDDILILNGDLYEKGKNNLDTLDYIMDLTKEYNIYITLGNCDKILSKLNYLDQKTFNFFAFDRGNSVINEMADILGIKLTKDINLKYLNKEYYNNFKKYYDFTSKFIDHIILNNKYYISHKGNTENILNNNKLVNNGYINISGHKPSVLFSSTYPTFNTLYYDSYNILMDGANNVCPFGQLNYLIIENDNISNDYVSEYNKFISKIDYKYDNNNPITVNSILNDIKYIDKIGDYFRYSYKNNIVYAHKSQVRSDLFCYFATNYFISLTKGEEYEICLLTDSLCIIKHNGITGYIDREVLDNAL